MNNDRATIARLNVLMKLEQKIGMLPASKDKVDSLSPVAPEPDLPVARKAGNPSAPAVLK